MRLTPQELKELQENAEQEGFNRGRVASVAAIEAEQHKNQQLIEGLSTMAGRVEHLKGVTLPGAVIDLEDDSPIDCKCPVCRSNSGEYVKRQEVLDLFLQLDPRVKGELAVRYPAMVTQQKRGTK